MEDVAPPPHRAIPPHQLFPPQVGHHHVSFYTGPFPLSLFFCTVSLSGACSRWCSSTGCSTLTFDLGHHGFSAAVTMGTSLTFTFLHRDKEITTGRVFSGCVGSVTHLGHSDSSLSRIMLLWRQDKLQVHMCIFLLLVLTATWCFVFHLNRAEGTALLTI